ncbi:hypothetical protein E2L07_05620 [Halalkalibacterium halodurans]|nr:hypothetical protein E2L07_05620 [Halalkalibacterium halodurans]
MISNELGFYHVEIPKLYLWMVDEVEDRSKKELLFKRYVKGYLAKSHPEMQLVRISQMTAVCTKREE